MTLGIDLISRIGLILSVGCWSKDSGVFKWAKFLTL